jgi:hypothetical protein
MSVTVTKYELSNILCEFLELPIGTIMRRDWVMKEVTYYMHSKDLFRGQVFILDDKLRSLMKNADGPFNTFSLLGYLMHHFIKKVDVEIKYDSIVNDMTSDEYFKEKYLRTMNELADGHGGILVYYVNMYKDIDHKNNKYDSIYRAKNMYDLWLKLDSLYNLYDDMDIDCILMDFEREYIRDERQINAQILLERLCDFHAVNLVNSETNWFQEFEEIKF